MINLWHHKVFFYFCLQNFPLELVVYRVLACESVFASCTFRSTNCHCLIRHTNIQVHRWGCHLYIFI